MKLCNYFFESSYQLIIPIYYAMKFISKVGLITLFCPDYVSNYPYFCSISPRFISFCMSRIWMDKSNFRNLFPFLFSKPRQPSWLCNCPHIYFPLQLSIILFLNEQTWYCMVYTQENQEISWKKSDQYIVS